jgi:nuclease S1
MRIYRSASAAAACLLTALFSTSSAWPWGPMGHHVAARMAESRMNPRALAAVHDLLGPGTRLVDVSTWADEQREFADSAAWHYVNIPISASRYDPGYCPPAGCIVSKIEEFRRILMDSQKGRSEKQVALKFLIHFVADLHQPLHVGDNNDKGGNLLQVQFYGIGSNLHKVWDSQIMERYTTNEQVWLWDFDGVTSPKLVQDWSKGTPEAWATESLELAKLAYRVPGTQQMIRPGANLQAPYSRFALPILQKQLAKAGIRTAAILNQIFQ